MVNKCNCFTESEREIIVSALMHDEADGVFDTDKSKKDYELVFDKLEGER